MKDQVSLRQKRLALLLQSTNGMIRAEDAARILELDRHKAARLLAGWHNQGVIRRVAHGLYVPVQPTALGKNQVLDDPWILVPELYDPGYVGGWSALEHWELTEQLFRSVCVLTSKRTVAGEAKHQGVGFYISHVPENRLFGTKTVWRGRIKVQVSDPHKTVLDILDDPFIGAGLQHTMDVIATYKKDYASTSDREMLLSHADKFGSGAIFKKLGFVAEYLGFEDDFVEECRKRLTQGYTHLDKKAKNTKLMTRWRLWVPKEYGIND